MGKWGSGEARHTARKDKDGIAELDDGEAPQIAEIDTVTGDAEGAEGEGEAVDEEEEEVQADDGVDAAREQAPRGDGVFFDELGEVVEPACCGVGEGGVSGRGVVRGWGKEWVGRGNGKGRGIPIARVRKEKPRRRPR